MRRVILLSVFLVPVTVMAGEIVVSPSAADNTVKRLGVGVWASSGLCSGGIAMSARRGQAAAVGIPVTLAANLIARKVVHSHPNVASILQFGSGAACLAFGATRSSATLPGSGVPGGGGKGGVGSGGSGGGSGASSSGSASGSGSGSGGTGSASGGSGSGSGSGAGGTGSGSGGLGSGSGSGSGGSGSGSGGSGSGSGSGAGGGNPPPTGCQTGPGFDCGFPGNGGWNGHGLPGKGISPVPGWPGH